MYETLAMRLTEFFINKNIIKNEDRDIYAYGYEVLISQIVYIVIMLIISLFFGAVFESILFFIGFYLFRKIAGGYHASTYIKCHLIFAINQLLFLLLLIFYPNKYIYIFILVAAIITFVITFICAPLDHPNKKFEPKEFKRYKRLSRGFSVLFMLLVTAICFLDKNNTSFFCFSVGTLSASISLMYAFIERRLRNA